MISHRGAIPLTFERVTFLIRHVDTLTFRQLSITKHVYMYMVVHLERE